MARPSQHRTTVSALRAAIGLSARSFARLIGRSFHTIQSLESGRLRLSPKLATRISSEIGVSTQWLLHGPPESPPVTDSGQIVTYDTYASRSSELFSLDYYDAKISTRLEKIMKNAANRNEFRLVIYRIDQFLKKLEEEFPSAPKVGESKQKRHE
jgi:transcriptional regulator with XRE-family HTH domain